MAPARDLLFGLLALQNGMVARDALVAAFGAWTAAPGRPLADLLAAQGALRPEHRPLLDALVEAHLELHGGDPGASLAALEVDRSAREVLAAAGGPDVEATLSRLGPGSGEPADRTATYAIGSAGGDGRRFRVLRPHARGGLGAVYVALDTELNREVALKQILDDHADDPASRQRFLLEAEVTGGLEHPGIVPVYGLGSYGGGRPYYAMRFIRGDSLKEAIARFHDDSGPAAGAGRRSLELRKLLRRFTDVCDAIDYAHSRGVLHRDIKPGNIIVGKHGETLVVDWGLAKPTGRAEPGADGGERTLVPASASGSGSTLPGSALGTPAYMSPEQAEGDLERLGPRSDVYSLGATLYCLLTGRPPFQGEVVDVLRDVREGRFPPPRRIDPGIDRALEAVCLKAMATRPADRYATPRALADDLERWMADEPVSAWREPWTRTLVRWLTRHRTGVTAAGAALLVALAGTAAVLAVQTRANGALKAANARVTSANAELAAANDRERARFDLAQEAIRTFHAGVSEDVLLKQEEFKALRTRLLQGARDFYRKLEALLEGQSDRESRLALARAFDDVGELSRQLDSIQEAEEIHRRALALFEALARDDPADAGARLGLARSSQHLGTILSGTGRRPDALACFERARDLLRDLAGADPGLRDEWARAEMLRAASLLSSGDPAEALVAARRARAIVEAGATPGAARPERVQLYGTLAMALEKSGRVEEGLAAYREACASAEALVRANPDDPQIAHELARNLGNMGLKLEGLGRHAEALAAFDRALEVLKVARAGHPTLIIFPSGIAWIETARAEALDRLGRADEALAGLDRARDARELLIKANPTVVRNREQLIRVFYLASEIHLRSGRTAEALAALERRRGVTAALVAQHPDRRDYARDLGTTDGQIALQLAKLGRHAEALLRADDAVRLLRTILDADPSARESRTYLGAAIRSRGIVLEAQGRPADAASAFREAVAMYRGVVRPAPVDVYDVACCLSLLSGVVGEAGRGPTADEAVATLRRAIAAGYREPAHMRADTDLDPIRSRPDYRALMLDLEFPVDPFARGR